MDFGRDGAERRVGALDEAGCRRVEAALADVPVGVPGVRLAQLPGLAALLAPAGAIGAVAAAWMGKRARPVRAVLFDKSPRSNWALGWHQDRTIVVAGRAEVDGFWPWTLKAGLIQVEPPFEIIARMVTLRLHLDPVDADNAPLRILPGSHTLGRLPEAEIEALAALGGEHACLAGRGDIWAYATAIVHGSRAATRPRRRRVLQIDYSADDLPPPLRWRGVG